MSFIKKSAFAVALFASCGYVAHLWEVHSTFEEIGNRLVNKLGRDIVDGLGAANQSCRGYAVVDSVAFKSDWLLADRGTAVLYISGKNGRAISLDYVVETAGDKVYVKPRDAATSQQDVYRFAVNDCG